MSRLQPQTLLIVDDSSQNIELLAQILQRDYRIKAAKNGAKAIEIARSSQPDLILLDIEMPEMDGYAVCENLKQCDETRRIPIIFVTARTEDFDEERGFELGAVDYIKKPYQSRIILSRIQTHLSLKLQQERLRRINEKNQRYLELIDRYVVTSSTDLQGNIIDLSTAMSQLSGYSKDELIGKKHSVLKSGAIESQTYSDLWNAITQGGVWQGELHNRAKDGSDFWLAATILPERDEDGVIIGYTSISSDITAKKLIEKLSEQDKLTQLYNRAKFEAVMEQEYGRSRRYGNPLSLILLDIDYFKRINDTYGHPIGDSVLVEMADILKRNVRKTDIVGRWGGEEFIILCIQTDLAGADRIAEHLRCVIEDHNFAHVGHKSASFGVAMLRDDETISELIARTDDALYEAKRGGRNRVCRSE